MTKKQKLLLCLYAIFIIILVCVLCAFLLHEDKEYISDVIVDTDESESQQSTVATTTEHEYDFSDVDIRVPNDYDDEDEDEDVEESDNGRKDLTWDANAGVWRTDGSDEDEVPVDPDVYEEIDFTDAVGIPPEEVSEDNLAYYYRDGDNEMEVDGDVEGTGDPEVFICSKDVNVVGGLPLDQAPTLDWSQPITGSVVGGRSIPAGYYTIVSGSIDLDPQMFYTAYKGDSLILYTVPSTQGHRDRHGVGERITIEDMKIYHVYDLVLEKADGNGLW